jgi:hypothetical protein
VRRAGLLLACAAFTGCVVAQIMPLPFKAQMGEAAGVLGWYALSLDALPETKAAPVHFGMREPDCAEVQKRLGTGGAPVWVLVHGVGGLGHEWNEIQADLKRQPMRAVLQYRWLPSQSLESLASDMAAGLTRLLQCAPPGPMKLRVFAHSAGGVLSSTAAARVAVPRHEPPLEVEVMTVASPLGGLVSRERSDVHDSLFYDDLGTDLRYAPAARGVNVVHVRTVYPGDSVMAPAPDGHRANDPRALVPGARIFTLAEGVTHMGALSLVGAHIGAGDYDAWVQQYAGLGPDVPKN